MEIARLEFRWDLSLETLPGVTGALDQLDGIVKHRSCGILSEKFLRAFEKALAQGRVFIAAKRREFLKLTTLLRVQARRHLDNQTREQIAAAPPINICNSFAAHFKHLPALRPGGHFQMRPAFKSRHINFATQSRNGKRDRYVTIQIIAFALKDLVLSNVYNHIKIARRTTARADLAVA